MKKEVFLMEQKQSFCNLKKQGVFLMEQKQLVFVAQKNRGFF